MFLNKLHSTSLCIHTTLFLCIILERLTWKPFSSLSERSYALLWKAFFKAEAGYFLLMLFVDQKRPTTSFLFLLSTHQMFSAVPFLLSLLCKLKRFPHSFICKESTGVHRKCCRSEQNTLSAEIYIELLIKMYASYSHPVILALKGLVNKTCKHKCWSHEVNNKYFFSDLL